MFQVIHAAIPWHHAVRQASWLPAEQAAAPMDSPHHVAAPLQAVAQVSFLARSISFSSFHMMLQFFITSL